MRGHRCEPQNPGLLGVSKAMKKTGFLWLTGGRGWRIEMGRVGGCGDAVRFVVAEQEVAMRARIEDTCTACGLCCDTCPEVFEMGDDMAVVIVDEVPPEHEDAVEQAADECPVEAIIIE